MSPTRVCASVIPKYTISRRCTPESLCILFSGSQCICVRFHGTCESVITNGSLALYRYVALRETVDTFATMRGRSGVTRNKRRKRGERETRTRWNLSERTREMKGWVRGTDRERERERTGSVGLIYLDLRRWRCLAVCARLEEDCESGRREREGEDFAQSHFGMQLNAVQWNTMPPPPPPLLLLLLLFPSSAQPLLCSVFPSPSFSFPPSLFLPRNTCRCSLPRTRMPWCAQVQQTGCFPNGRVLTRRKVDSRLVSDEMRFSSLQSALLSSEQI